MTGAQLAGTLTLADAVTLLLLVHQVCAEPDAVPGTGREPRPGWQQPAAYRAAVHQATGMISIQLDVSVTEALARLRAHAHQKQNTDPWPTPRQNRRAAKTPRILAVQAM